MPLAIVCDLHIGDSTTGKNVGLDIGFVPLAGHPLNNSAHEAVAKVRVSPLSARCARKRHVLDSGGNQLFLAPTAVVHHRVVAVSGPAAGGVGKKMV